MFPSWLLPTQNLPSTQNSTNSKPSVYRQPVLRGLGRPVRQTLANRIPLKIKDTTVNWQYCTLRLARGTADGPQTGAPWTACFHTNKLFIFSTFEEWFILGNLLDTGYSQGDPDGDGPTLVQFQRINVGPCLDHVRTNKLQWRIFKGRHPRGRHKNNWSN